MLNMHDFYWCGVKLESDYLHHGCGRVGLDADSKFTKQDRMQSKKKTESAHLCTKCREIGKAGRRLSLRSGSELNVGK